MFFILLMILSSVFLVGTLLLKDRLSSIGPFRIFFPSWRFFETTAPIPKILYRIDQGPNEKTSPIWHQLTLPSSPRTFTQLFHNPEENLRLASLSQVEQLLNEIALAENPDSDYCARLASFRIVTAWIQFEIKKCHPTISDDVSDDVSEAISKSTPDRTSGVFSGEDRQSRLHFKIGVLEFGALKESSKPQWTDALSWHEQEGP